jgi:hypothetical protein
MKREISDLEVMDDLEEEKREILRKIEIKISNSKGVFMIVR